VTESKHIRIHQFTRNKRFAKIGIMFNTKMKRNKVKMHHSEYDKTSTDTIYREGKTIHVRAEGEYRIIAISDIHGYKKPLEKLLKKLDLKEDDYLVILGDFLNRGLDSYEMAQYIRELSKRPRTIILKGNHEWFMVRAMTAYERADELVSFLKKGYYETLIHTLALKDDIDLYNLENNVLLLNHLNDAYADLIAFLDQLPIILKFNDLTFVHGGLDTDFDLEHEEVKFLKYDEYNDKGNANEDPVIVGHWPICNIRTDCITNVPYYNREKNIIFIDGGLGVKVTGELNAFIIEKADAPGAHKEKQWHYSYLQENDFEEKRIVTEHCFELETPIFINYPHFEFDVIKRGDKMTKCRHHHSGMFFSVFNELLVEGPMGYTLKTDYINQFLNLKIGEVVLVCQRFDDCLLVKYGDIFGWILPFQIED
jgi:protein phosphatase